MGTPERELSDLAKSYGGTRESYREESPQHRLTLPGFALAQTPVTNALYSRYVAVTGRRSPLTWHGSEPPAEQRDHPVVDVSWDEAQSFCIWLNDQLTNEALQVIDAMGQQPVCYNLQSAVRLPSEAEWEYAARGSEGYTFPWGNSFDPKCANTRETGVARTTPVGSYPEGASPYGLLDMAGNVWEWTTTLDHIYPYNADDGREAAQASGRRILRGGCYANPQGFSRCACRFRLPPTVRNEFIGFRLAFSRIE
ncbi:MAG: formylglycine-generating enzyme family protein [Chloroflexales bacterium]|nr:formylglycine-generating enzyme family protein [Chloroflexales bacterium]